MIPNGKLSLLLILSVELHCPSLSSALTCGARKYYHYCGNPSRFTTRVRRTRPSAPPPRHSDQWPVRIDSSITRLYVDKDSNDGTNPSPERWAKTRSRPALFTLLISIAGAILGPFLDTYHSVFGVLLYEKPISLVLWGSADFPGLVTAWWVPELFALAGFIIGWLYILLDDVLPTGQVSRKSPTPPTILFGIALFTLQYWLSGLLYQTGMDRTIILNVMSTIAVVGFYYLDGTLAGGLVSAATAMGGPLIELLLLSLSRSGGMGDSGYQYLDLGETGFFPLWIVPVYFLGGPAVGNLARGIWDSLAGAAVTAKGSEMDDTTTCPACNDSRRVPCPNCDGVGRYIAMGGRSIDCTSCRGRGFVLCRVCFDKYGKDPNDVEAIRDLLSRMPD